MQKLNLTGANFELVKLLLTTDVIVMLLYQAANFKKKKYNFLPLKKFCTIFFQRINDVLNQNAKLFQNYIRNK